MLKADGALPSGYGHMFVHYDFAAGTEADGGLHAIIRFRDRATGHAAETSFGAHIFNTVLTFGSEPQSYVGPPPGLSTRLFLRHGHGGCETLCHLIYPALTPWHAASATDLVLHDAGGAERARKRVAIPCNGSLLWRASEMFGRDAIAAAGEGGYVIIRDTTCRLFSDVLQVVQARPCLDRLELGFATALTISSKSTPRWFGVGGWIPAAT